MKATRYEYMMYVREFLNKLEERDFATNDYLEISGNTPEWAKHYKNITTTSYPQVDAHNLPYADGSYDCVALNQVLEHVEKPWVVIDEAYRVLRSGGVAIICSPFFYQEHQYPVDYWRFTLSGLVKLCEKFSSVPIKRRCGSPSLMKHMIDNPKDRKSSAMQALAHMPLEQNDIYYVKSLVIAKK